MLSMRGVVLARRIGTDNPRMRRAGPLSDGTVLVAVLLGFVGGAAIAHEEQPRGETGEKTPSSKKYRNRKCARNWGVSPKAMEKSVQYITARGRTQCNSSTSKALQPSPKTES